MRSRTERTPTSLPVSRSRTERIPRPSSAKIWTASERGWSEAMVRGGSRLREAMSRFMRVASTAVWGRGTSRLVRSPPHSAHSSAPSWLWCPQDGQLVDMRLASRGFEDRSDCADDTEWAGWGRREICGIFWWRAWDRRTANESRWMCCVGPLPDPPPEYRWREKRSLLTLGALAG